MYCFRFKKTLKFRKLLKKKESKVLKVIHLNCSIPKSKSLDYKLIKIKSKSGTGFHNKMKFI